MAGKVGPHRESHEPRLKAHNFIAEGVSPTIGYLEWDGTVGVGENWGMDFNDQFGDCGAAATDHNNIAKTQSYAQYGQLGMPQYEGTLGTYGAYGKSMGFTPLVPSPVGQIPDQGVDNASWLGFLYKQGVIKGYGEVTDGYYDWFCQNFRGAIVGQVLAASVAQQDFDDYPRKPWDAMAKEDGHDTLGIITHSDGSGSLITWGGVQPYTLSYRRANWTDMWVIFDEDDPNVNWAALQAALNEIHGTVTVPTLEDNSFLRRVERYVEKEFERLSA